MAKILVFGDSIAWGAFDNERGGWVERLKTFFLQNHKEKGMEVYNFAVSSDDTRGILEFLETDIKKIDKIEQDDYILLFSIGSNDSRYINEKNNLFVPQEEFEKNLQKIINIAKKHSKKIFFTGLLRVDDNLTQPWDKNEFWENKIIKDYNDIIEIVCKSRQISFIPLFNLINETELSDGLHPNAKAHEKIFNHIKGYLLNYF